MRPPLLRSFVAISLLLISAAATLAGCGNKGPLVKPVDQTQQRR